jgi:hypothetical protein
MGPVEVLFYSGIGTFLVGGAVYLIGRLAVEWHVRDTERTERQIQAYLYRIMTQPAPDQPTTLGPPFVPPLLASQSPSLAPVPSPRMSRLRQTLIHRLTDTEIQSIAFDLNLIEVNEADSKPAQVRAMLTELRNYQRIDELIEWLAEHRSDIELEDYH